MCFSEIDVAWRHFGDRWRNGSFRLKRPFQGLERLGALLQQRVRLQKRLRGGLERDLEWLVWFAGGLERILKVPERLQRVLGARAGG